jgi:pimeloyl-ACP methyl ester carboxylesterase
MASQPVKLVSESYQIPALDSGVQLYVRNKRPAAMTSFTSERTVLFVHGSTYPSETTFDLELNGQSWMDYIAEHGYDVYLMDVRGYGRSTRPREMEEPAGQSGPIVHTDVAVRDFGTVVDHILQRRGISKLNLLAWSWGTIIAGAYTAQNNDKVERLALYAPIWLRQTPAAFQADGSPGAYRTVTMDSARQRWMQGVAPKKQEELLPGGWFETWWSANLEADPAGAKEIPPVVRAPNGVVADGQKYWGADTRYYDPSKIRAPVLLIHADWDVEAPAYMSQALLARLTAAAARRYVIVSEGTHFVMMEKSRTQLFHEVQLFLDQR